MSVLALILSGITLVASPSPTPLATGFGYLPVIIDVHTSAVCTTLRQTVIPVGFIAKTNDAAFGDVKDRTMKVGMSMISDQKDFEFLAHHDQVDTQAVVTNIALAQKLLDDSRKRFPDEKNPDVAAMRAELESVIDIQRQYSSIVDAIAGAYLDSTSNQKLFGGMYGQNTSDVQARNLQAERDFINSNRVLLGLPPLEGLPLPGSGPGGTSQNVLADTMTQASPGARQQVDAQQLDAQLGEAEGRLRAMAIAAQRLCTHASSPPH
jgi:hypothetical protein